MQLIKKDFNGSTVSTVVDSKNKTTYWVAKEVANQLGYNQKTGTGDMIKIIDDKYIIDKNSLYRVSGMTKENFKFPVHHSQKLISEAGLYQAMFSSTLPNAVKFRQWVLEKVLPSIMQNGYFISEEAKLNPSDKLIEESKGILATRLGIDNTRDELIAHINEYLKEEAWNPHSLPNALSNCYQHLHIATKGMIASQVLEEEIRTSPEGLQLTNWRQKRKLPKIYSADYGVAQNYYTDEELLKFNNRFIMILQRVVTHIQLYPKLTPMTVLALIKKASRDMVYETSMHVAGEQFKGKNGKKIRKLLKQFVKDEIEFQEIDLLLSNITLGNKFTLGES